MKNKDFDNLFKSKLKENKKSPNPALWDQLEGLLDEDKNRKKKNFLPIMAIAASLALIALFTIGFLQNSSSEKINLPIASISEKELLLEPNRPEVSNSDLVFKDKKVKNDLKKMKIDKSKRESRSSKNQHSIASKDAKKIEKEKENSMKNGIQVRVAIHSKKKPQAPEVHIAINSRPAEKRPVLQPELSAPQQLAVTAREKFDNTVNALKDVDLKELAGENNLIASLFKQPNNEN